MVGPFTISRGWVGSSQSKLLLPKLLYLFWSLPVSVYRMNLLCFQTKVLKFIRGSRSPKLACATLYTPSSKGGIGCPWFSMGSTRQHNLMQWSIVCSHHKRPNRVQLKQQAVSFYTIDYLLWRPLKDRLLIQSPTLAHSLGLREAQLFCWSLDIPHWHTYLIILIFSLVWILAHLNGG